MSSLQQARAEYELNKHLQLFHGDEALLLARDAALLGSLNDRVELTIVRVAVQGAFLVLNDADRLYFIAGGHRADADDKFSPIEFGSGTAAWLQLGETDRSTWISLFQEITAIGAKEAHSASERVLSISALHRNCRISNIPATSALAQLSFFAGVPLTSKNGHNIGAICVVDRCERPPLSASEARFLSESARRYIDLLEAARERGFHNGWTAMQDELDIFLRSRSLHAQLLEEPQTLRGRTSSRQKTEEHKPSQQRPERIDSNASANNPLAGLHDSPVEGKESRRLAEAEVRRDHRIAERDHTQDAQSLTAQRGKDDDRGLPKGETPYRKVFRRAAECLRLALKADGVLFVDGLIGLHGDVQAVAEPEQELEREIACPTAQHDKAAQRETPSGEDRTDTPYGTINSYGPHPPGTHSRIYSSPEYLKGVYVDRPAEVLGVAGSDEVLRLARVSDSTVGLPTIDEGFLQRMMDRHPKGAVWYSSDSRFLQVKSETLEEVDLQEEAHRIGSGFTKVKQLLFMPLTEPNSLKRLGACFAWRMRSIPLFTDAIDLGSLKAFLHVVESEVARHDAALVLKQKESFVASVSHELRTPLHGILGAVQLLDESGLDQMQKSLAEIISTCGATLHETLTSVLSYAKINQFERRQHAYRQRRPPDSVWALTNKSGLASGPDRDYEGLYICTNLAILCEEILGVLETGKSFQHSNGDSVIVVCNIEHQDTWSFYTEPGVLRRIAVNLIGNALKYTKSGYVVVTLSANTLIQDTRTISNDLTTGRTITFTVRDTGRGMSREFMDNQLFLPFTQEDSTSSHGVGLGMSIVKSLISLLSGEIQVQSKENEGTEIHVRMPMRMCSPDGEEKGHPALEHEHNTQTIRTRKLSTVTYGFPQNVRESLKGYLCDWYGCIMIEPTVDARPDIVLVDEGNEEVLEAVKATAQAYGKHAVLLSIVMVPSRMGKRMDLIDGYIKWERIPRPLGPSNVAKGLLSCIQKLDELHEHEQDATVNGMKMEEEPQPKNGPANLQGLTESSRGEQYMPNLEKVQISEASQTSHVCPELWTSLPEPSKSTTDKRQEDTRERPPGKSMDQRRRSGYGSSGIVRILIVDDNALNLTLLGAFLKKIGYHDTKQAKNGREAVAAAQNCAEQFDIIFMDLSMPVMDGFEAIRQIRTMEAESEHDPATKDSVIIALTGLASQKDEDEAFQAGVDLYLTKPVQFSRLSDLLHEYEDGTLKRHRRSKADD